MTIRLESKRPDEVRDYLHDWVPFLGADTIASEVTTAEGVTLDSVTVEAGDQSVKFWVSGGADGEVGQITHTITTAAGRTESELFVLPVCAAEQVSLAEVKASLRVRHTDEDAKIAAMIPRARLWVEDHTGLALRRREFVERHTPRWGAIRLFKGPLVADVAADVEVTYLDAGVETTYVPRSFPPSSVIFPAADESWPGLADGEQFTVTYTAGFDVGEADDRLIGAMLALIEGEFSEGYAYPQRAVEAAERCCAYLRQMVA
jgi:uncharacterized phiE125 gp8 family phage protein